MISRLAVRFYLFFILGILQIVVGAQSWAAGFDCAKAATKVEKMICQDAGLSSLDDDLMRAYKNALVSATDKEALKKYQLWWLKFTRNVCPTPACLEDAYKARITALAIPAVFGFEEEKSREDTFIAKAKTKEMNCSHEAQALVDKIPGEFDRDTTQNIFIYECLRGMIKAQRFDEAKQQIETLRGNPQIWGMRVLGTIGNIPSYVMTGKLTPRDYRGVDCEYGQKYRGPDLEKLTVAILKRINPNEGDPSDRSWPLGGFGAYLFDLFTPDCLEKSQLIRMYNLLLGSGLKTTFWSEGGTTNVRSSYANDFSNVMWLGDETLARRILKGGITVGKENTLLFLFVRAPNMKMVRLLEEYGFSLTKGEAQKVLKILDEELYPEGANLPDEDVMKYYQTLAK